MFPRCLTLLLLFCLPVNLWINTARLEAQTSLPILVANARYDQGLREYTQRIIAHPKDDEARFALSVLLYLRTIERMGQTLHHHGTHPDKIALAQWFTAPPLPQATRAEPISYAQFREALRQYRDDLSETANMLGGIASTDVRVTIDLGRISFDWNADARIGDSEQYLSPDVYRHLISRESAANQEHFLAHLSRIDLLAIRSHVALSAAAVEYVLAHDWEQAWDQTACLFFSGAKARQDYLQEERLGAVAAAATLTGSTRSWLDQAAAWHQSQCLLLEPAALASVHQNLLLAVRCQREMYALIKETWNKELDAETPRSHLAAIHFVSRRIEAEEIERRLTELDQLDQTLRGQLLFPFWRGTNEERGINVRRFFFEPPAQLDVIMLAHGNAWSNYLEIGDCCRSEVWRAPLHLIRHLQLVPRTALD